MEKDKDHHDEQNLRWYEDGVTFETLREAHEWAYSEIYNEIGTLYDGYKTYDEKIAYALVYELTRANTLYGNRFRIYTDYELTAPQTLLYKVWVTPASE